MATTSILEEHLTCSVCFDVYKDPQSLLPCLHTFCKPCIDKLITSSRVECPQCREVCLVSNIRKDFKTQALIDTYYKDNNVDAAKQTVHAEGKKCGMCNGDDIQFYCGQCVYYICQNCKGIHGNIKDLQSHVITSIIDIKTAAGKQLTTASQQWKYNIQSVTAKIKAIDSSMEKLLTEKETNIQKVKGHISKFITKLEKHQMEYIEQIEAADAAARSELLKQKQYATELQVEIIAKVQVLESVTSANDLHMVQEMSRNVKENLQTEIDNMLARLNKITSEFKTQLEVFIPAENAMETGIKIVRKPDTINDDTVCSDALTGTLDFSALEKNSFIKTKSVKNNDTIVNISVINSELWCAAGSSGVIVYSTELELILSIQTPGPAQAVTQANTGHIVAACSDKGLYVITKSGTAHQISAGSFSDVKPYCDKLIALDSDKHFIKLFLFKDGIWTMSKRIKFDITHSSDRLSVYNHAVYASRWFENHIQCVHLNGHYGRPYGSYGRTQPGELYNPNICDIYGNGNALVVDSANNRLKVLKTESGVWVVVQLSDDISRPRYAVVTDCDNTIWIATDNNYKELIKYVKI